MAIPDFSFKGEFPVSQVIQGMQEKAYQENAQKRQREQDEFNRVKLIADAMTNATKTMVEGHAQQQVKSAQKSLAELMTKPQTPEIIGQEKGFALTGYPDIAGKQAAEQLFSEKKLETENPYKGKTQLFTNKEGKAVLLTPNSDGTFNIPAGFQEAGVQRINTITEPREIQAETARRKNVEVETANVNPAQSKAPNIRSNYQQLLRAEAAGVLLQLNKGNPPAIQMRELASSIIPIVQGGGSTGRIARELIDEYTPKTLVGSAETKLGWIMNKAEPTKQQSFVKKFAETIIGESGNLERNLRFEQAKKYDAMIKRGYTQDELSSFVSETGLDPSRIKKNKNGSVSGYDFTGDYQSILPNFNPYNWNAEELMSNASLLSPKMQEAVNTAPGWAADKEARYQELLRKKQQGTLR